MAIIKLGALISGIRGTVGGVIFSENGSGPYAKLWAPPSQPMTSRQTIQRALLSQMPNLWRDLTPVEQTAWDTFAALAAQELFNPLGESYYASGFAWFNKCNIRLLRVGRATRSAVPTQARPGAATIDDFRICVAGTESDLSICGVVSSSTDIPPGGADSNAFDNNLATYWSTAAPLTTGWIAYDHCDPHNVKHYAIWHPNIAWSTYPKTWTFEVWTGGAWEILHTVTDMVWTLNAWNHFYFPNPYTETKYRWNVTVNMGHATSLRILELQMFAGDEGASVVCYPEDNFSNAPTYDLILHISIGGSTGKQVQYPGYYEILAQQSPGRWFTTFQGQLPPVFGTVLEQRSWFCRLYRQTTEGLRSTAITARTETIIT